MTASFFSTVRWVLFWYMFYGWDYYTGLMYSNIKPYTAAGLVTADRLGNLAFLVLTAILICFYGRIYYTAIQKQEIYSAYFKNIVLLLIGLVTICNIAMTVPNWTTSIDDTIQLPFWSVNYAYLMATAYFIAAFQLYLLMTRTLNQFIKSIHSTNSATAITIHRRGLELKSWTVVFIVALIGKGVFFICYSGEPIYCSETVDFIVIGSYYLLFDLLPVVAILAFYQSSIRNTTNNSKQRDGQRDIYDALYPVNSSGGIDVYDGETANPRGSREEGERLLPQHLPTPDTDPAASEADILVARLTNISNAGSILPPAI